MKTIYISNETLMNMIQETYLRIVKEQLRESVNRTNRTNILEEGERNYFDVTATILKETQKAYYVSVKYFTEKGLSIKEAKMWCPKSCCVIENGNVTKIADFVLNRWQQEYFDFLKSKGYKSSPICFDLSHLQNTLDKKKKEKDEYQTFYDEVLKRLTEDLGLVFEKNIKGMGMYSKMLGLYLSYNGLVPSDKCDKLINLGDVIINKFGESEERTNIENFFNKNPDRNKLYAITEDFRDLLYGFSTKTHLADYPKFPNCSTEDIIHREIEYFMRKDTTLSKLYRNRKFKEYIEYKDKFENTVFDALNSIE